MKTGTETGTERGSCARVFVHVFEEVAKKIVISLRQFRRSRNLNQQTEKSRPREIQARQQNGSRWREEAVVKSDPIAKLLTIANESDEVVSSKGRIASFRFLLRVRILLEDLLKVLEGGRDLLLVEASRLLNLGQRLGVEFVSHSPPK